MNTIKNVLRANGFITSYVEDEELFTITRNGEGKPTFVRSTRGRWVSQEATFTYDQAGKFTGLVGDGFQTSMLPDLLDDANGGANSSSPVPVNLSADYTVTSADDGVIFNCTAALTITTPAGLSPKPSFIPVPPPTGNLSLAFTGGATGNGSAATQTFTRATSPTGVAVVAYEDGANGYGVGAGGSGGATTFAALTDKATVDLPAVNTPLAAALSAKANATVEATISANRTITSADDGGIFPCTTALTITVPGGLTPRPGFIPVPPPTGNLTLTPSGAATLNGAATPIVRTFASNRNGVLVTPNPHDVNDYSVSGV